MVLFDVGAPCMGDCAYVVLKLKIDANDINSINDATGMAIFVLYN